jgi:Pectate lyase superfamily protein
MSNYTKTTNFGAKDTLPSGDSQKIVRGTEFDTEFNAISTAIATKLESGSSSADVNFLQSGTGATTRTVQSKLRETLSVTDFGAVGNGTTDDTAAIQAAVNAASFGGIVLFPGNKQYLTTAPIVLKGSVTLMGEGTDNTKPEFGHFSQIYSYHNGATFIFNGATVPKAYQWSNLRFVNLKMMSNKTLYPQSVGIVATKTYGGCTVDSCHMRAYGKCLSLTTTYGFLINNTSLISSDYGVFVDCTAPAIPVTDGLYQTNVLQIKNSNIGTQTGTGVYFYGPGNLLNITSSVIEDNNIGIYVRKYSGAAPAGSLDINQDLASVNIKDNYFESNTNGHILLGSSDGTEWVSDVNVTGNNINKDNTLTQCIHINAVRNGVFQNSFRYGALVTPYRLLTYPRSVDLYLGDGQIYDGNFSVSTTNRCRVIFANPANRITNVYVEPGNVNAITGDSVTRYYAGNSTQPVATLADAVNLINFFENNYRALNASEAIIYVKNSGTAGTLTTLPACLSRINIYRDPSSTTTPEIAGVTVNGAKSVHIQGPMNLLKQGSQLAHYLANFGGNLFIENCSFNFVTPATNSAFATSANTGIVSLNSNVTSIGDQPTFGVVATRGTVFRGGSAIAGSSGDQNTNGTIVA